MTTHSESLRTVLAFLAVFGFTFNSLQHCGWKKMCRERDGELLQDMDMKLLHSWLCAS